MPKGTFVDRTGQVYGYLTVISVVNKKHYKEPTKWLCKCKCGTEKEFQLGSFISGKSISCGCYQKEEGKQPGFKHGLSKTRTYKTWAAMLSRTAYKIKSYEERYWGRGIDVSDRWLTFENFLEDMGEKPKWATIERIDNDKGYSKENCKWLSLAEQQSNKSNNVWLEVNGIKKTQAKWAEEYELHGNTINQRLKAGWSVERACTTPVKKRNKNV